MPEKNKTTKKGRRKLSLEEVRFIDGGKNANEDMTKESYLSESNQDVDEIIRKGLEATESFEQSMRTHENELDISENSNKTEHQEQLIMNATYLDDRGLRHKKMSLLEDGLEKERDIFTNISGETEIVDDFQDKIGTHKLSRKFDVYGNQIDAVDKIKFTDISNNKEREFEFKVLSVLNENGENINVASYEDEKSGINYQFNYVTGEMHEFSEVTEQGKKIKKETWKISDNHVRERFESDGALHEIDLLTVEGSNGSRMQKKETITKDGKILVVEHDLVLRRTQSNNGEIIEITDTFNVDGVERTLVTEKAASIYDKTALVTKKQKESFITYDKDGNEVKNNISYTYTNGEYEGCLEVLTTNENVIETGRDKNGNCAIKKIYDADGNLLKKTDNGIEYNYEYIMSKKPQAIHTVATYTTKQGVENKTDSYSYKDTDYETTEELGVICKTQKSSRKKGKESFSIDEMQYSVDEVKLQARIEELGYKNIKEKKIDLDQKTGILKVQVGNETDGLELEFINNNFVKVVEKKNNQKLKELIIEQLSNGNVRETSEYFTKENATKQEKLKNSDNQELLVQNYIKKSTLINGTLVETPVLVEELIYEKNAKGEFKAQVVTINEKKAGEKSNKTILDVNGSSWNEIVIEKDGINYTEKHLIKNGEQRQESLLIRDYKEGEVDYHQETFIDGKTVTIAKNKNKEEIYKKTALIDKDGVETFITEDYIDEKTQKKVSKKSELVKNADGKIYYNCTYSNLSEHMNGSIYLEEFDTIKNTTRKVSFSRSDGTFGDVICDKNGIIYEQFDEKDDNGNVIGRVKRWVDVDGCFHSLTMSKNNNFSENTDTIETFIDSKGTLHTIKHINKDSYQEEYTDNMGIKHEVEVKIDSALNKKTRKDVYEKDNTTYETLTIYLTENMIGKTIYTTVDKDGIKEVITDEKVSDDKGVLRSKVFVQRYDQNGESLEQFETYGTEKSRYFVEKRSLEINGKTVDYENNVFIENGKKVRTKGTYELDGIKHEIITEFGKSGKVTDKWESYIDKKGCYYKIVEAENLQNINKENEKYGTLKRQITYEQDNVNHVKNIYEKEGIRSEIDIYGKVVEHKKQLVPCDVVSEFTVKNGVKTTIKTYTEKGKDSVLFTETITEDADGTLHIVDSRNKEQEYIVEKGQEANTKHYKMTKKAKTSTGKVEDCIFDVKEYIAEDGTKHTKTTRVWKEAEGFNWQELEEIDSYTDAQGKVCSKGKKFFEWGKEGAEKEGFFGEYTSFIDESGREVVSLIYPNGRKVTNNLIYEKDGHCAYQMFTEFKNEKRTGSNGDYYKEVKRTTETYFDDDGSVLTKWLYDEKGLVLDKKYGWSKPPITDSNGITFKTICSEGEVLYDHGTGDALQKTQKAIVHKIKEIPTNEGKLVCDDYAHEGVLYHVKKTLDKKNEEKEEVTEFIDLQGLRHVNVLRYKNDNGRNIVFEKEESITDKNGKTETLFYKAHTDANGKVQYASDGQLHYFAETIVNGKKHIIESYVHTDAKLNGFRIDIKNKEDVKIESYVGDDGNVYFAKHTTRMVGPAPYVTNTEYYKSSVKKPHFEMKCDCKDFTLQKEGFSTNELEIGQEFNKVKNNSQGIEFNTPLQSNLAYEETITQVKNDGTKAVAKISTKTTPSKRRTPEGYDILDGNKVTIVAENTLAFVSDLWGNDALRITHQRPGKKGYNRSKSNILNPASDSEFHTAKEDFESLNDSFDCRYLDARNDQKISGSCHNRNYDEYLKHLDESRIDVGLEKDFFKNHTDIQILEALGMAWQKITPNKTLSGCLKNLTNSDNAVRNAAGQGVFAELSKLGDEDRRKLATEMENLDWEQLGIGEYKNVAKAMVTWCKKDKVCAFDLHEYGANSGVTRWVDFSDSKLMSGAKSFLELSLLQQLPAILTEKLNNEHIIEEKGTEVKRYKYAIEDPVKYMKPFEEYNQSNYQTIYKEIDTPSGQATFEIVRGWDRGWNCFEQYGSRTKIYKEKDGHDFVTITEVNQQESLQNYSLAKQQKKSGSIIFDYVDKNIAQNFEEPIQSMNIKAGSNFDFNNAGIIDFDQAKKRAVNVKGGKFELDGRTYEESLASTTDPLKNNLKIRKVYLTNDPKVILQEQEQFTDSNGCMHLRTINKQGKYTETYKDKNNCEHSIERNGSQETETYYQGNILHKKQTVYGKNNEILSFKEEYMDENGLHQVTMEKPKTIKESSLKDRAFDGMVIVDRCIDIHNPHLEKIQYRFKDKNNASQGEHTYTVTTDHRFDNYDGKGSSFTQIEESFLNQQTGVRQIGHTVFAKGKLTSQNLYQTETFALKDFGNLEEAENLKKAKAFLKDCEPAQYVVQTLNQSGEILSTLVSTGTNIIPNSNKEVAYEFEELTPEGNLKRTRVRTEKNADGTTMEYYETGDWQGTIAIQSSSSKGLLSVYPKYVQNALENYAEAVRDDNGKVTDLKIKGMVHEEWTSSYDANGKIQRPEHIMTITDGDQKITLKTIIDRYTDNSELLITVENVKNKTKENHHMYTLNGIKWHEITMYQDDKATWTQKEHETKGSLNKNKDSNYVETYEYKTNEKGVQEQVLKESEQEIFEDALKLEHRVKKTAKKAPNGNDYYYCDAFKDKDQVEHSVHYLKILKAKKDPKEEDQYDYYKMYDEYTDKDGTKHTVTYFTDTKTNFKWQEDVFTRDGKIHNVKIYVENGEEHRREIIGTEEVSNDKDGQVIYKTTIHDNYKDASGIEHQRVITETTNGIPEFSETYIDKNKKFHKKEGKLFDDGTIETFQDYIIEEGKEPLLSQEAKFVDDTKNKVIITKYNSSKFETDEAGFTWLLDESGKKVTKVASKFSDTTEIYRNLEPQKSHLAVKEVTKYQTLDGKYYQKEVGLNKERQMVETTYELDATGKIKGTYHATFEVTQDNNTPVKKMLSDTFAEVQSQAGYKAMITRGFSKSFPDYSKGSGIEGQEEKKFDTVSTLKEINGKQAQQTFYYEVGESPKTDAREVLAKGLETPNKSMKYCTTDYLDENKKVHRLLEYNHDGKSYAEETLFFDSGLLPACLTVKSSMPIQSKQLGEDFLKKSVQKGTAFLTAESNDDVFYNAVREDGTKENHTYKVKQGTLKSDGISANNEKCIIEERVKLTDKNGKVTFEDFVIEIQGQTQKRYKKDQQDKSYEKLYLEKDNLGNDKWYLEVSQDQEISKGSSTRNISKSLYEVNPVTGLKIPLKVYQESYEDKPKPQPQPQPQPLKQNSAFQDGPMMFTGGVGAQVNDPLMFAGAVGAQANSPFIGLTEIDAATTKSNTKAVSSTDLNYNVPSKEALAKMDFYSEMQNNYCEIYDKAKKTLEGNKNQKDVSKVIIPIVTLDNYDTLETLINQARGQKKIGDKIANKMIANIKNLKEHTTCIESNTFLDKEGKMQVKLNFKENKITYADLFEGLGKEEKDAFDKVFKQLAGVEDTNKKTADTMLDLFTYYSQMENTKQKYAPKILTPDALNLNKLFLDNELQETNKKTGGKENTLLGESVMYANTRNQKAFLLPVEQLGPNVSFTVKNVGALEGKIIKSVSYYDSDGIEHTLGTKEDKNRKVTTTVKRQSDSKSYDVKMEDMPVSTYSDTYTDKNGVGHCVYRRVLKEVNPTDGKTYEYLAITDETTKKDQKGNKYEETIDIYYDSVGRKHTRVTKKHNEVQNPSQSGLGLGGMNISIDTFEGQDKKIHNYVTFSMARTMTNPYGSKDSKIVNSTVSHAYDLVGVKNVDDEMLQQLVNNAALIHDKTLSIDKEGKANWRWVPAKGNISSYDSDNPKENKTIEFHNLNVVGEVARINNVLEKVMRKDGYKAEDFQELFDTTNTDLKVGDFRSKEWDEYKVQTKAYEGIKSTVWAYANVTNVTDDDLDYWTNCQNEKDQMMKDLKFVQEYLEGAKTGSEMCNVQKAVACEAAVAKFLSFLTDIAWGGFGKLTGGIHKIVIKTTEQSKGDPNAELLNMFSTDVAAMQDGGYIARVIGDKVFSKGMMSLEGLLEKEVEKALDAATKGAYKTVWKPMNKIMKATGDFLGSMADVTDVYNVDGWQARLDSLEQLADVVVSESMTWHKDKKNKALQKKLEDQRLDEFCNIMGYGNKEAALNFKGVYNKNKTAMQNFEKAQKDNLQEAMTAQKELKNFKATHPNCTDPQDANYQQYQACLNKLTAVTTRQAHITMANQALEEQALQNSKNYAKATENALIEQQRRLLEANPFDNNWNDEQKVAYNKKMTEGYREAIAMSGASLVMTKDKMQEILSKDQNFKGPQFDAVWQANGQPIENLGTPILKLLEDNLKHSDDVFGNEKLNIGGFMDEINCFEAICKQLEVLKATGTMTDKEIKDQIIIMKAGVKNKKAERILKNVEDLYNDSTNDPRKPVGFHLDERFDNGVPVYNGYSTKMTRKIDEEIRASEAEKQAERIRQQKFEQEGINYLIAESLGTTPEKLPKPEGMGKEIAKDYALNALRIFGTAATAFLGMPNISNIIENTWESPPKQIKSSEALMAQLAAKAWKNTDLAMSFAIPKATNPDNLKMEYDKSNRIWELKDVTDPANPVTIPKNNNNNYNTQQALFGQNLSNEIEKAYLLDPNVKAYKAKIDAQQEADRVAKAAFEAEHLRLQQAEQNLTQEQELKQEELEKLKREKLEWEQRYHNFAQAYEEHAREANEFYNEVQKLQKQIAEQAMKISPEMSTVSGTESIQQGQLMLEQQ